MSRKVYCFLLLLFVMVGAGTLMLRAQEADLPDGPAGDTLSGLRQRLEALRKDREQVKLELAEANKRFFRFRHDVVYTNGPAADLHQEIVALEKQLVAKRRKLQEITRDMPEVQEMTRRRKSLYERIRRLTEQEQLLENEIKARRLREAADARQTE